MPRLISLLKNSFIRFVENTAQSLKSLYNWGSDKPAKIVILLRIPKTFSMSSKGSYVFLSIDISLQYSLKKYNQRIIGTVGLLKKFHSCLFMSQSMTDYWE